MCGILACIFENECAKVLINGLEQLKNRGYDSAGICTLQNQQLIVTKYATTENCDAYLKLHEQLHQHQSSFIGIAHTRWATHGEKTNVNSHPHISMCGKFAVVHNGIIDNYNELKTMLLTHGIVFLSQTDTEVIAHLLSILYKTTPNVIECINQLISQLKGTWGLAIICTDEPTTLFCTRRGCPLLVGINDVTHCAMVVSEQSGFCGNVSHYFVLKTDDILTLTKMDKKVHIDAKYDIYKKMPAIFNTHSLTPFPYVHWTLKEIMEQSNSSLRAIQNRVDPHLNQVILNEFDSYIPTLIGIDNLVLLGCGTSYFAGMHGLHFFKELCEFNNVQLIDGAEFTCYDIPKYGTTALLFISQSGETKDLHRCIDIGKQHNLFLIGMVNVPDSLIAREVNCVCYLNAGREVGVASTKSYSSQVIVLALISIWFSQIKKTNTSQHIQIINDIIKLPADIQHTLNLNTHDAINRVVNVLFSTPLVQDFNSNIINHCFVLGKGKSESVAKEGALKIKEMSYIHGEGYSTSSLKHGPFALLNENFPVILISPYNEHYIKNKNAFEEIKSRHSLVLVITNKQLNNVDNVLYVSENNPTFADLLCVIPLQLLAYHIATSRKINPDMPRNLAKVVTVE